MIDYQTFHQIRQLRDEEHLSVEQIAAALSLDERTVGKWINEEKYLPRQTNRRSGKLDPFKRSIVQWLTGSISLLSPLRLVVGEPSSRIGKPSHNLTEATR